MENKTNILTGLAISDAHGNLPNPKSLVNQNPNGVDVIAFTGDIAPTYPENLIPGFKDGAKFTPSDWRLWNFRKVDEEAEGKKQKEWIEATLIPWLKQIPHKKTVFLNGNHDFGNFEGLFDYYIRSGVLNFEIEGFKFSAVTGIPIIVGEWFDEIHDFDFQERILKSDKDCDILLTHAPAQGILDNYAGQHCGFDSLRKAIFGGAFGSFPPHYEKLKLHIFGHIHGEAGTLDTEVEGREIKFLNVATKVKKFTLTN